jgi:heat shock protein HtpX
MSQISIPSAFAFGKTQADGRVCVTQGIRKLLNKDELKAVIGHEISHLKHRDMMIITLLSVVPLIFYWVAQSFLWGGTSGNRKGSGNSGGLIGIGAMGAYFVSNLLVLYGSRIREYYADEGSVKIGNSPHQMASALYKLAYASSQVGVTGKGNEELRRIQGFKALFLNDTSQGWREVRQLKELDGDSDGSINQNDLLALRSKEIKLGPSESIFEVFTTHPNMLKRVKRLATLT